MHADAYARARKLLGTGSHALAAARVLGVLHSLLILSLLAVAGLLASLLASQGEARLPTRELDELPSWVRGRATGVDQDVTVFDDSGIFPVVAANRSSANVLHGVGARVLQRSIRSVPTLMNNVGALTSLLALAAGLFLALSLLAQTRRSILAEAACEVATSLRRQFHRQMYRLGQS